MPVYPEPLQRLISELSQMPGIGPKSAQRLAFYVLNLNSAQISRLTSAIQDVREKIKFCSQCFNLTDQNPCRICSDLSRRNNILCVVAEPKDLMAVEKTGEYKGHYHVLGGTISPLEGIGPEKLHISELLQRLAQNGKIEEIIFATNPTVEGEATLIYLTKLLKPFGIKLTRIAYGLPVGSDIDFADQVTIAKAFEGRREIF